jgi:hypothetical protein
MKGFCRGNSGFTGFRNGFPIIEHSENSSDRYPDKFNKREGVYRYQIDS